MLSLIWITVILSLMESQIYFRVLRTIFSELVSPVDEFLQIILIDRLLGSLGRYENILNGDWRKSQTVIRQSIQVLLDHISTKWGSRINWQVLLHSILLNNLELIGLLSESQRLHSSVLGQHFDIRS